MIELAAAHGYDAASVVALSKRARVSKRSFYERFSSKEECFLSTYDAIVSQSVRTILAAAAGEEEWRERLRLGILSFAGQISNRPAAARLILVEVFAAGAVAVERMLRTQRLFELLVAKNLGLADGPRRMPPLVVKGIVAGCSRLARARLLAAHPGKPALDGGQLLAWSLSLCHEDVGRLRHLRAAEASPLRSDGNELPLGDERALILAATAKLASNSGYAALTVPQVCATAGISRRSFNSHFGGVADCFLTTLEALTDRAMATAEASYLGAGDQASGIHRMIVRVCRQLAGDPAFARLAFLEVFSPSPETIRWRCCGGRSRRSSGRPCSPPKPPWARSGA
jgi:AcrR family transcriptional regulator